MDQCVDLLRGGVRARGWTRLPWLRFFCVMSRACYPRGREIHSWPQLVQVQARSVLLFMIEQPPIRALDGHVSSEPGAAMPYQMALTSTLALAGQLPRFLSGWGIGPAHCCGARRN